MDLKSKDLVLREMSNNIKDQAILMKDKDSLERRIILKLNSLGVKGTNYSEVVIKLSSIRDKYADVFHAIEGLVERRDLINKELNIIEETISYARDKMKDASSLEYEVFNLRYFEGLTLKEIAERKSYSLDRIKQISADISKKFSCQ